jgi:hypothetical protein
VHFGAFCSFYLSPQHQRFLTAISQHFLFFLEELDCLVSKKVVKKEEDWSGNQEYLSDLREKQLDSSKQTEITPTSIFIFKDFN